MVEYLAECSNTSREQTRLQSPLKAGLKSVSATPSPAKLAPNHSLFMASIDNSPVRRKLPVDLTAEESLARSDSDINMGGRSSTRVIESLHEQIDALTSTNLQLTIQSNNLLDKLENAQQRESKLLESTSSLKHENENLGSMLNRKTRKLKDLEGELSRIKLEFDSSVEEKTRLVEQYENKNEKARLMEDKMEMIQSQYDAMADAQKYYKAHYKTQLSELREEIESLKLEQVQFLEKTSRDSKIVDVKLQDFDQKYDNLQQAEELRARFLNDRCNNILKEFNLESWVNLYKESKKMVLTYAERMEFDLPDDFLAMNEDPVLVDLESKTSQQFIMNNNDNSPPYALKNPKLRNRTHGSSGNNAHSKRSSFYGGNKQVPNSPLPGTLPGVRRSSSRRTKSGTSDVSNSSAESSPVLPSSGSRNASSPSPRMIQSSSFRKKYDA